VGAHVHRRNRRRRGLVKPADQDHEGAHPVVLRSVPDVQVLVGVQKRWEYSGVVEQPASTKPTPSGGGLAKPKDQTYMKVRTPVT
jgi:hypothetical protein